MNVHVHVQHEDKNNEGRGGGGTGYVDIYLLPFVPVVFENNCRKLLSR